MGLPSNEPGFEIIIAKIDQIAEQEYLFTQPLLIELCVNPLPDDWLIKKLKSLLAKMMAKIAREEGISNLKTPDDEDILKDHLPAHITNLIARLSEIIYAETLINASKIMPAEERLFCSHAFLKLIEWIVWNYDQRCLYGKNLDENAVELTKKASIGVNVYGSKDEVWLSIIDYLSGVKNAVELSKPIYGCVFYAGMYCIKIEPTPTKYTDNSEANWGRLCIIVHEPKIDIVRFEAGFKPFGDTAIAQVLQKNFLNELMEELYNNFGGDFED